eukprot:2850438-Amphidinium_carterae.1
MEVLLSQSAAMPGIVTILCHAECLAAWTSFWAPCRGRWPLEWSKFPAAFEVREQNNVMDADLVSRKDVCGLRWHMNGKECMDTALEHLAWLLYPKFAHYAFTITAFRIVKRRFTGNGMTVQASYVVLKFVWLVVTLFGPCLPILNTLIALLANIYSILLFGTAAQVLDVKETAEQHFLLEVKDIATASLPSFGFSTAALLGLALQASNFL